MEGLTTSQVAELLKKEGFRDDVVQLFVENKVDGEALMMLKTIKDMKAVGLTKIGDRIKIQKLIKKYKEDANTKEIPPADHHKRELVRKKIMRIWSELYYTTYYCENCYHQVCFIWLLCFCISLHSYIRAYSML